MNFTVYRYRKYVKEIGCNERGQGDTCTSKNSATQNILSLKDLKDDVFMHISTYLDVNDIYNLCRISKRFHESNSQLSKSMMGGKLKANLGNALIHSNVPGLTIESFNELCELCSPHQVVISGGTTAKAILGKQWVSDVDIYVDYQAAKMVRSWFIKKWHQILIDAKAFYPNGVDDEDEKIFLLERYTTMPQDDTEIIDRRTNDRSIFKRSEVYRKRLPLRVTSFGRYYYIETVDGGKTLPYSSLLMHRKRPTSEGGVVNIDLIIGCPGVRPADMINDFDLSIVMNMYNGKVFRVFHPSTSFVGSSLVFREPQFFEWIKMSSMYMHTQSCRRFSASSAIFGSDSICRARSSTLAPSMYAVAFPARKASPEKI